MNEKSTKIRILYIITKSIWAGAQKYVYDLATNLPKDEFKPMVAAGGKGTMAKKLKAAGIDYFEIKNFQRNINFIKEISAFLEVLFLLFKTKPRIIHVSSPKAGGIAGGAVFIYKIVKKPIIIAKTLFFKHHLPQTKLLKTIFTPHGWAFHEPRPRWQIFLIKFFSKLTCLFYDKIICVSKYDYYSALKNKITNLKKLIVIPNGIKFQEYEFFPKEKAREIIAGKFLTNNDFVVGTIGEFTKNKGQKYLIEAIAESERKRNNIKALIIGFGEEAANLKNQISKFQLEKQIILIENLPEAARYLKAFDIFILPSLKEGLPYVVLEAGLAKLPVIATSVGGIPEIIENKKTGILIKPAGSKELAKALDLLVKNVELKKIIAEALYQKVVKKFALKKMLKKTTELYQV